MTGPQKASIAARHASAKAKTRDAHYAAKHAHYRAAEKHAMAAMHAKQNEDYKKSDYHHQKALEHYAKGDAEAQLARSAVNPGRKVKGGRAVSLRNFTGSVIRKSNGQVVIRGKGKR